MNKHLTELKLQHKQATHHLSSSSGLKMDQ